MHHTRLPHVIMPIYWFEYDQAVFRYVISDANQHVCLTSRLDSSDIGCLLAIIYQVNGLLHINESPKCNSVPNQTRYRGD